MLTAFGALAVTAMMAFYALESRSRWFTFAFAVGCFASSTYGWLAHTWPFGVVEAVWGVIALRKFWTGPDAGGTERAGRLPH